MPDTSNDPNATAEAELTRLIAIMAKLRDPDGGCPWDLEQDFASIAPYTIEEAYEVADAIARDDMADLRDELGDLLLQVVFHARMAEEAGHFGFAEVAASISEKMLRRHPHVFGDVEVTGAEAQTRHWEELKAAERAAKAPTNSPASALDGVPVALPAATRALKLQQRAARVGFDWPQAAQILSKIDEEVAELKAEIAEDSGPERLADELGDLLFTVINLARRLDLDPECVLRATNDKFERRFKEMESQLRADGCALQEQSLDTLEAAWQSAKKALRGA